MYNAEQKKRFIRDFTVNKNIGEIASRMFASFESYENEWGADLCTKDAEALYPAFEQFAGIREISQRMPLEILHAYVRWCLDHDIPGACDGGLQIGGLGLRKMATHTVKSPMHLQQYLNAICVPEDLLTVDNNIRSFLWLAYAGMASDDIFRVRKGDVDLANLRVECGENSFVFCAEGLPAIRNSTTLDSFRYVHPEYPDKDNIFIPRVPGDLILRGWKAQPNARSFTTMIGKYSGNAIEAGKTKLRLNYYHTWLSGLFYRTWQNELIGIPPDFTSLTGGRVYIGKMGGRDAMPAWRIRKQHEEYLADYLRWKETLTMQL